MARRSNPDTSTLLMIGGGALLLYFLFRKSGEAGSEAPTSDSAIVPEFSQAPSRTSDVFDIPKATVRQPSQITITDWKLPADVFQPAQQTSTFGVGVKTSSLSNSPSYGGSSSSTTKLSGYGGNIAFM
jgi:hypothetical protein